MINKQLVTGHEQRHETPTDRNRCCNVHVIASQILPLSFIPGETFSSHLFLALIRKAFSLYGHLIRALH